MLREYKIFLFLAFIFPFKADAQPNSTKAKTYAVVIGITKYQNNIIPALSFADKDATLFADWLRNNKVNNLKENNLKLFLNEDASIANIYRSFNWLKTVVSKDDYVYLYFSGHGDIETDKQTSKGYLLAWNSPPNNYANNAIAIEDINELANYLTTVNKAKIILITDACHSGKMAGDFYKGRELTANNLKLVLNNQVRLAACQADELAAEGPGWGGGRGVFSYYLLKGLGGLAKPNSNNNIKVEDLKSYLEVSFKTDAGLQIEKHTQHPVVDGSHIFVLAKYDSASIKAGKNLNTILKGPSTINKNGLQSLKSLGEQPIDYFFKIANQSDLDSMVDYKIYLNLPASEWPSKMVHDYFEKLKQVKKIAEEVYSNDTEHYTDQMNTQYRERDERIIENLENQLTTDKYLVDRFKENLVQLVHKKCQKIINAYLTGDLAEIEKRQYYNTGKKPYTNFLSLIQLAINITPENNYLYKILNINKHYLSGLENRMQMAISEKNSDSLLRIAFSEQHLAMQLEPYAAYIQNELGNLYLYKNNFDSALYYYDYASSLAPAWAIPWSNKIRVYFATQKLKEASAAAQVASDLQPNLSIVNVNAGMVMEKDSNWLAAEGYFLNAIKQNSSHYLPYERLGFVYLNTGDYTKAEKYFKEAEMRKNSFAVNDKVFEFGIEASGPTEILEPPGEAKICNSTQEKSIIGWSDFLVLSELIPKIKGINNMDAKEIIALKSLLLKSPQLPFAAHYLGKKYYDLNDNLNAEKTLKQAIQNQIPDDNVVKVLSFKLKNLLEAKKTDTEKDSIVKNSCLLKNLQNLEYDNLEDFYMLANIYEQNKNLEQAIQQYKKAGEIENRKLLDQANYKDYGIPKSKGVYKNVEESNFDYEEPIKMISAIKMAQLYEQLGKFDSAEFVLLDQVKKDRIAGFARETQINLGNTGVTKSTENTFWLLANEDLEAATYNFYIKVLEQFPRDGDWYKKAGQFLHERLGLTYNQIPLKEQKNFYTNSLITPYPFKKEEEGRHAMSEVSNQRIKITNEFEIPVTHEKINIEMKIYDPVLSSVNFINQAIKYSGDIVADPELLISLADLYCWMGNSEEAINNFEKYLQQKPNDIDVRNRLVDYLHFSNQFVAEAQQLSILNNSRSLQTDQLLKLAQYKILGKEFAAAKLILANITPKDSTQKNEFTNNRIRLYIQDKNYKKALSLLADSLTFTIYDSLEAKNKPNEKILENQKYFNAIYTQVRLYALVKQNKKATSFLKDLVEAGYNYPEVLKNDPLLKNIRKQRNWKNIFIDKIIQPNEVSESYYGENRRPELEYRIPKKK